MAETSSTTNPCPICGQQGCAFLPTTREFQVSRKYSFEVEFCNASMADHNQYFREQCKQCDLGPPQNSTLCSRCQHLRLRHILGFRCSLPGQQVRVIIGTLAEIQLRRDGCEFCGFLCAAISTRWKAQHDEDIFKLGAKVTADITIYLLSRGQPGKCIIAKDANHRLCEVYLDIDYDDGSPARAFREVSPKFSLELIKEWVVDCREKSAHHDVDSQKVGLLPQDFRVIDIKNGRIKLVELAPGLRYIALSYVWGHSDNKPDLLSTMKTITKLETPGSLRKENLPATIWDSMTICTALDVPYLWVDRLCIVQDDYAGKMAQIAAMDQIYSQAVLTICASGSPHSDSGLCGTRDRPRTFGPGHTRIGTLDILARLPSELDWRSQVWWTRAWTYQELLLSPKKLLFSPWQVTFRCDEHNHTQHEDTMTFRTLHGPDAREAQAHTPIDKYLGAVTNYNSRALTLDYDIFNAFLGIFKQIYEDLDQFLHGLPKVDFDQALLWDIRTEGPGSQRQRVPRKIESSADIVIPSWSWASFRGYTTWMQIPIISGIRTCISIAKWNCVDQGNGELCFRGIVARGSRRKEERIEFCEDWGVMYAWSARAMGCIEDLTSESQDSTDWEYYPMRSKTWERWRRYHDYWDEAFTSRLGRPWICDNTTKESLLAKENRGRVVLRAALAQATIRCDHQGCRLQDTYNATLGTLVAHHNCEQLTGKEWLCVALSIGPALKTTLGAVVVSNNISIEAEIQGKLLRPNT